MTLFSSADFYRFTLNLPRDLADDIDTDMYKYFSTKLYHTNNNVGFNFFVEFYKMIYVDLVAFLQPKFCLQ